MPAVNVLPPEEQIALTSVLLRTPEGTEYRIQRNRPGQWRAIVYGKKDSCHFSPWYPERSAVEQFLSKIPKRKAKKAKKTKKKAGRRK